MAINIVEFNKKFIEEYNFLYDNNDNVAGYSEAVYAFDCKMNKNESFRNFVGEFANYRSDFISSNREAAAFMFALEDVYLKDMLSQIQERSIAQ